MTLNDFVQTHNEQRRLCEDKLAEFAEMATQLVGMTCSDGALVHAALSACSLQVHLVVPCAAAWDMDTISH